MDESQFDRVEPAHAAELSSNQVESLVKAMGGIQCHEPNDRESLAVSDELNELFERLRDIHQAFADQASHQLSLLLKTNVRMNKVQVQRASAQSVQKQIGIYDWASELNPHPMPGAWLLAVPANLCCVFVDRLLGGTPTAGETFDRQMSSLEKGLMQRAAEVLMKSLSQCWKPIEEIIWTANHAIADVSRVVADTETRDWILVSVATELCQNLAEIKLLIPISSIEARTSEITAVFNESGSSNRPTLQRNLACAPVCVSVNVAKSTMKTYS